MINELAKQVHQKFRPILFSTPMVQAIVEGRKTMTRRKVKPPFSDWVTDENLLTKWGEGINSQCRYGKVGDVLWVRETWQKVNGNEYLFKANSLGDNLKWKPSIFMPKAACRIFLEITDIKVERLKDISEDDAIAEGIERIPGLPFVVRWKDYTHDDNELLYARNSFKSLWVKINGAKSLSANPFVWVISFKKITKPQNFK